MYFTRISSFSFCVYLRSSLTSDTGIQPDGQLMDTDHENPYWDQQGHCLHIHSPSAWSFCSAFPLPSNKNLCLHWDVKMGFWGQKFPIFSKCPHLNKPLSFSTSTCLTSLAFVASGSWTWVWLHSDPVTSANSLTNPDLSCEWSHSWSQVAIDWHTHSQALLRAATSSQTRRRTWSSQSHESNNHCVKQLSFGVTCYGAKANMLKLSAYRWCFYI